MTEPRPFTIALAGNPNSGKSTIFNNLTGARQHVGNYPGVTVEKKEGEREHRGVTLKIVDLPGTYSLTAYSVEELIARHFVVEQKPDAVVDILDASNLERNLYLAVQFMELGLPLALAMNMSDVAKARGQEIDYDQLSKLLGLPIVPTVGHKKQGMAELLDTIVKVARGEVASDPAPIHYGPEIEEEIRKIQDRLAPHPVVDAGGARWLAIKLLENDREVREQIQRDYPHADDILAAVETSSKHLERVFSDPPEIVIADRRYGFISGACQESVRTSVEVRHTRSDQIDALMTNRVLGIPIFLGLMFLVFKLVFWLGEPPMGWIDRAFDGLAQQVRIFWPKGSESDVLSLMVDGVIGGVGGVIAFLPNILLLFLAIALLEDSGYMARAAFVVDRVMHKIGLHGKSFIPMLIGFGCTVPAILATRTLETRRDRLTTILILPLMSCGARLTIYALLIPAFFPPAWRAIMLWAIYLIGIALAILAAKLLRLFVFKGATSPFVMELPPYRLPTLRGTLIHMWERGWMYLRKAGTVILGVSVVLWALGRYPRTAGDAAYPARIEQARSTYLAQVDTLDAGLGLRDSDDALRTFAGAQLTFQDAADCWWERQSEYRQAAEARDAALAAIGEKYPAFQRFLDVRQTVAEAESQFEQAKARLGVKAETDPRIQALVEARDRRLNAIRTAQPAAYDALLAFRRMKGAYVEQRVELENRQAGDHLARTYIGRIGRGLETVLRPLGFDWKISTALVGALAAKEVFVAQLGVIYSLGETDPGEYEDVYRESAGPLGERLQKAVYPEDHPRAGQRVYTPLVAFCIMLFCLVSAPCMVTIVITARETGSWRWGLIQLGGLTVLAYLLTLIVYQVGTWLKIGVA